MKTFIIILIILGILSLISVVSVTVYITQRNTNDFCIKPKLNNFSISDNCKKDKIENGTTCTVTAETDYKCDIDKFTCNNGKINALPTCTKEKSQVICKIPEIVGMSSTNCTDGNIIGGTKCNITADTNYTCNTSTITCQEDGTWDMLGSNLQCVTTPCKCPDKTISNNDWILKDTCSDSTSFKQNNVINYTYNNTQTTCGGNNVAKATCGEGGIWKYSIPDNNCTSNCKTLLGNSLKEQVTLNCDKDNKDGSNCKLNWSNTDAQNNKGICTSYDHKDHLDQDDPSLWSKLPKDYNNIGYPINLNCQNGVWKYKDKTLGKDDDRIWCFLEAPSCNDIATKSWGRNLCLCNDTECWANTNGKACKSDGTCPDI